MEAKTMWVIWGIDMRHLHARKIALAANVPSLDDEMARAERREARRLAWERKCEREDNEPARIGPEM